MSLSLFSVITPVIAIFAAIASAFAFHSRVCSLVELGGRLPLLFTKTMLTEIPKSTGAAKSADHISCHKALESGSKAREVVRFVSREMGIIEFRIPLSGIVCFVVALLFLQIIFALMLLQDLLGYGVPSERMVDVILHLIWAFVAPLLLSLALLIVFSVMYIRSHLLHRLKVLARKHGIVCYDEDSGKLTLIKAVNDPHFCELK